MREIFALELGNADHVSIYLISFDIFPRILLSSLVLGMHIDYGSMAILNSIFYMVFGFCVNVLFVLFLIDFMSPFLDDVQSLMKSD
ncbi:hypothetical protein KFK09_021128 [Dendrobium nobile]|uniref:Uncharacterized protein n=1 Tax=Dendrobium nobile TaxID=94219 RepID=A0A8T3AP50_DENNO|nr:hypothetical protein KFK09_021128 [Dendrobium nobile]